VRPVLGWIARTSGCLTTYRLYKESSNGFTSALWPLKPRWKRRSRFEATRRESNLQGGFFTPGQDLICFCLPLPSLSGQGSRSEPFQVATHLETDRVSHGPGRVRIFEPGTSVQCTGARYATIEPPCCLEAGIWLKLSILCLVPERSIRKSRLLRCRCKKNCSTFQRLYEFMTILVSLL
jgi:hypothetical protein